MKKITLLALISLMMVGCSKEMVKPTVTSNSVIVVDGITQDSCEYYPSYGHKGNCKFCAERRKKELDSLVIEIWEGFE
jgi:uncharacterized protein YcfL